MTSTTPLDLPWGFPKFLPKRSLRDFWSKALIFTGKDNINVDKYSHSVIHLEISTVYLLCIRHTAVWTRRAAQKGMGDCLCFTEMWYPLLILTIVRSHRGDEEAHGRVVFTASLCWGQGIWPVCLWAVARTHVFYFHLEHVSAGVRPSPVLF